MGVRDASDASECGRPSVAVIGAGISGLTAAYVLRQTHRVTLFEREPRLGGHAHTHDVPTRSGSMPVDSGFIVLNDRTYPLLNRLFAELGVATRPTEMSMSIRCDGCGLAYVGGRGADGIFAQRRRIADPRFLRMLTEVHRFQRAARQHLREAPQSLETYGAFLRRLRFGEHFVHHYALPVVACVWSMGGNDARDYPAAYLFEFLANHGFLSLRDAPQWHVVAGGSRTYVHAIRQHLGDVRVADPATAVARKDDRVVVIDADGREQAFDRVVLATHADEALALLTDATEDEFEILGAFDYSVNATRLHRDLSVLSEHRRERASWNFRLASCDQQNDDVQVSYWMNRLQGHDESDPVVVTLNDDVAVDPAAMVAEMRYGHPIFNPTSVAAQRRLPELNTTQTAFAGAYHGWGFHEDGCRAGVAAAAHFGVSW
jgi:predicted NAD/FAD-binding protein